MTSRWVVHAQVAFEASHALRVYLGAAESKHSHHWRVAIAVGAEGLNAEGYALDFNLIQQLLKEATDDLVGGDLNDHPEVGQPSPTAERVAIVVASRLASRLVPLGGTLRSVSVWEGPENRVDLILD
jgi:6-pyruvoyl-tetrahydropterin synthase